MELKEINLITHFMTEQCGCRIQMTWDDIMPVVEAIRKRYPTYDIKIDKYATWITWEGGCLQFHIDTYKTSLECTIKAVMEFLKEYANADDTIPPINFE